MSTGLSYRSSLACRLSWAIVRPSVLLGCGTPGDSMSGDLSEMHPRSRPTGGGCLRIASDDKLDRRACQYPGMPAPKALVGGHRPRPAAARSAHRVLSSLRSHVHHSRESDEDRASVGGQHLPRDLAGPVAEEEGHDLGDRLGPGPPRDQAEIVL